MSAFEREKKSATPIVAICYDFDKTLSPTDMQAQGYIQSLKYDVNSFWQKCSALAVDNDMDENLAWMYMMVLEAEGKLIPKRETLEEYGAGVELFPGVDTWFERINEFAKPKGIIIEHYIVSSGVKEMIEGTSIAKRGVFKKVYASSFYYNDKGVAVWPAQTINFTGKTQYLFRISKGVLNVNDPDVNNHFEPEDIRIPFRNIIYIGDSDTDIPCMKLVKTYGGHSIGVYDWRNMDKSKVQKMIHDDRISYYAAADYQDGGELDQLVKTIIDRTAQNELLEQLKIKCKQETTEAYDGKTIEQQKRNDLIVELGASGSFFNTHNVIRRMKDFNWEEEERKRLYKIAIESNQVNWIIKDPDIMSFYKRLIAQETKMSDVAKAVNNLIK